MTYMKTFKRFRKRKKCVHKYQVVGIKNKFDEVGIRKKYTLLCDKCNKRMKVYDYDYRAMQSEGLIKSN